MTSIHFRARVLRYCKEMHASETSGFRTTKRNADVGGHPNSHHLRGMAVDVAYDAQPTLDLAEAAADKHGLHVFREGTHDHLTPHDLPPAV